MQNNEDYDADVKRLQPQIHLQMMCWAPSLKVNIDAILQMIRYLENHIWPELFKNANRRAVASLQGIYNYMKEHKEDIVKSHAYQNTLRLYKYFEWDRPVEPYYCVGVTMWWKAAIRHPNHIRCMDTFSKCQYRMLESLNRMVCRSATEAKDEFLKPHNILKMRLWNCRHLYNTGKREIGRTHVLAYAFEDLLSQCQSKAWEYFFATNPETGIIEDIPDINSEMFRSSPKYEDVVETLQESEAVGVQAKATLFDFDPFFNSHDPRNQAGFEWDDRTRKGTLYGQWHEVLQSQSEDIFELEK